MFASLGDGKHLAWTNGLRKVVQLYSAASADDGPIFIAMLVALETQALHRHDMNDFGLEGIVKDHGLVISPGPDEDLVFQDGI